MGSLDTTPEHFVRSRQFAASTQYLYLHYLQDFTTWCESRSLRREDAEAADVRTYLDAKQEAGSAASSVDGVFSVLNSYYRWLDEIGAIDKSPTRHMRTRKRIWTPAPYVSVDDLRKMLLATKSDREWLVIALLGFYSLMPKEVAHCEVTDFDDSAELARLHIVPHATHTRSTALVLAPEVTQRLREVIGDRKSGRILTDLSKTKPMNRSTISRIVQRAGERASVGKKVTPKLLQYTLPSAALNGGFSYLSVMRSMGVIQPRHSARWLNANDRPDEENASLRLARLVLSPPDSAEGWFVHVEALLRESDVPEHAAVVMAGAVVERHLRQLAHAHGIAPAKDSSKGGISYYVGELQRTNILTVPDARRFRAIGDIRNDAAHGWFERVATGSGMRVLREAQELLRTYPVTGA